MINNWSIKLYVQWVHKTVEQEDNKSNYADLLKYFR